MTEHRPARDPLAVIAAVEGNGDGVYKTLPIGHDVALTILQALEDAGLAIVCADCLGWIQIGRAR